MALNHYTVAGSSSSPDLNHKIFGLNPWPRLPSLLFLAAAALILTAFLAGCSGIRTPLEKTAREDIAKVSARYRPDEARPELPKLSHESQLGDYLRFAMLNNPKIEAAYYDWISSVESITTARSLPDPRLTFSMDIADIVTSVMAGLMVDLPGPGKLRAAGDVAAAVGQGRYWAFETEVLRAVYDVKIAYYRLRFLENNIDVQKQTLRLLGDLEQLAKQQNAAGRTTLQDVLRAQIEQDKLQSQIDNLEDSRGALLAEFKAALGLGVDQADPPAPKIFTPSADSPDREEILASALKRNPTLKMIEADVLRAQNMMEVARRTGWPDVTLAGEVNLQSIPTVWKPSISISLPIWRDKIAAEVATAQAGRLAAEARLSSEQIRLATELASMLYVYRESERNSALLEQKLVPKGRQSVQAARVGYATGKSGFLDVIEGYRQLLGFDLSLIEARTQREMALASLSVLIAGVPPQDSPVLGQDEHSGLEHEENAK